MQKKFVELVTGFITEAGLDIDVVPGEDFVPVPVGDITVNIGFYENRRAVVFQGVVGLLPSSEREAFCLELLRMNSFFVKTQGATLAVENDAVTLQATIALDAGGEERSQCAFNALAVNFLESFATVMQDFSDIADRSKLEATTEDEQSQLMPMMDMLRI